jgi:hypothetical protein
MIVMIELRPIQGHSELLAWANHIRHPVSEILPNIDPGVAQQPVYLFNRVLGNQSPGLGQPLSYGVYRQRGERLFSN